MGQTLQQERRREKSSSRENELPRIYTKRVRLSGRTYDLAVACLKNTNWHWLGLVLLNNEVLQAGYTCREEREEAMKDAYCIANMHAGIPRDYPERFEYRWRKLPLPFPEDLIWRQERLEQHPGRGRPRLQ